jgi:Fe-S oxidoreductase
MCRQVCPVGLVTARETLTPHAWALTIESVKRGQLTWNRETADVMYTCADCGLCRSHCVTDQPLPDAIADARAEIVRRGFAPAIVAEVDRKLRHVPDLKVQPTTPPGLPPSRKASADRPTSALFVGDAGAPTVQAAVDLLKAIGTDVVPICDGRSSGLLASSLGLRETAEILGRAVIDEVVASGASELLVLAPSDRWTFEYVYPRRLELEWPAVSVREVTEVLAHALADDRLRIAPARDDVPYAYHDPCHAPRVARERPAARALIAAALGSSSSHNLFWREHRAHPCGAIGGLEFTSPDIARQLAMARLDDASSAGARVLITEDPACLAHLGAHAHSGFTVTGLYELLADRLQR